MKLQDAIAILGLTGEITLESAKQAYRRACMKYHPDRNPGGLEMMKAVNAAWEVMQGLDWDRPVESTGEDEGYGEGLSAFINAVIDLEGVEVEVCGSWVWLSGDTKPHKEVIKAAGGKWASKKCRWYFRPEGWKPSRKKGEWDMDRIREQHGSSVVRGVAKKRVSRQRPTTGRHGAANEQQAG